MRFFGAWDYSAMVSAFENFVVCLRRGGELVIGGGDRGLLIRDGRLECR